jgi:hypothetical protein
VIGVGDLGNHNIKAVSQAFFYLPQTPSATTASSCASEIAAPPDWRGAASVRDGALVFTASSHDLSRSYSLRAVTWTASPLALSTLILTSVTSPAGEASGLTRCSVYTSV